MNFDVRRIKWDPFIQNHAYGIKRYIYGEEAYMPSAGWVDARTKMYSPLTEQLLRPWSHRFYQKDFANFDDLKSMVFASKWVKDEITKKIKNELKKANSRGGNASTGVSLRDRITSDVNK